MREFPIKGLDLFSDSGIEGDYETAIEQSNTSFIDECWSIELPAGLIAEYRRSYSSTSFSLVNGYNEGADDLGGEKSRPDDVTDGKHFRFCVAENPLVEIPVSDFYNYYKSREAVQRGQAWNLGSDHAVEDYLSLGEFRTPSYDLDYASDLTTSQEADLIAAISSQIGPKATKIVLRDDLADLVDAAIAASNRVSLSNSTVRVTNNCNAALARINMRTEELFAALDNELKSERKTSLRM